MREKMVLETKEPLTARAPTAHGGKDVFMHISAVKRAGLSGLTEGQTVEFELVTNRAKRPRRI
jgi:cold shock CspA family protein